MPIVRWNPWSIDRFLDEDWELPTIPGISRLVGQGLNLYETDDAVVAQVALPGVPEDKIDISIDNNVVRITGSTEDTKEEKNKRKYFMSSMSSSYNYSFRLPEGVVTDQEPTSELQDGVLTLKFAKAQKTPPKKIQVKRTSKTNK